jgi:hypothetical protein
VAKNGIKNIKSTANDSCPNMICIRHTGQIIRSISDQAICPGMIVCPSDRSVGQYDGDIGLMVKPCEFVDGSAWVISDVWMRINRPNLSDLPTYLIGEALPILAMLPGDMAYVRTTAANMIPGDRVAIDIGDPGTVMRASSSCWFGYCVEPPINGYVRIIFK